LNKEDIEIVAAGHTCLDLIPTFTIDGKVDKLTNVLVPGKMINMGKCVVVGGDLLQMLVYLSAGSV